LEGGVVEITKVAPFVAFFEIIKVITELFIPVVPLLLGSALRSGYGAPRRG
jgi:hypothetical protein